jgi:hypothetical protein
MIPKPKPTGNDVVDQWHLECWEAEKALKDAVDALNNYPLDGEEWHKLRNEVNATKFKLNEIYDQLPYSDIDDRTISGALQSISSLDVTQAAKCINSYLKSRPNTVIVKYEAQFELDRYEWTVEKLVVYDDKETVVSHHEIVGKIWIEQPADGTMISGQKIKITLGYGMADGETKIINGYLLADVWRGCVNACADLADKISDAEAADKSLFVNRDKVKEHWKKIPNIGNDMQIVKKWNDGWSAKQIAVFFEYDLERKVYKRLGYLRKKFPTEVLTSKVRKQYGIPRKM